MNEQNNFSFLCPECQQELQAETQWRGLQGNCQACGTVFAIPADSHSENSLRTLSVYNPNIEKAAPLYKSSVTEKLIHIVSRPQRFTPQKRSTHQSRNHLSELYIDADNRREEVEAHRNALEEEGLELWEKLRAKAVTTSLENIKLLEFQSLEGIGPDAIAEMSTAGIKNALDVIHQPSKLDTLSLWNQKNRNDLRNFCIDQKFSMEVTFYPSFIDLSDESAEMLLLKILLEMEAADQNLMEMNKCITILSEALEALPSVSLSERIRRVEAAPLTQDQLRLYEVAIYADQKLRQIETPQRMKGPLSQEEFIRALGLLEAIHPRRENPANTGAPNRQPNAHRSNKTPIRAGEYHPVQEKGNVENHSQDSEHLSPMPTKSTAPQTWDLLYPHDRELTNEIEAFPLNENLMHGIILRNYQRFATKFMLSQKKVIIGDEMGLGKTIQALTAIAHLQTHALESGRNIQALVICPASVRLNWLREIGKFTPLPVYPFQGKSDAENFSYWQWEGGIMVTSYESLKQFSDQIESMDVCIVDEAQYIKNPDAIRTIHSRELLKKSEYAFCMTGTPIENNLEEFLEILESVRPGAGKELQTERFLLDDPDQFTKRIKHLYLRRNKQDVLLELPPLNLIQESVELNEEELEHHLAYIDNPEMHLMQVRQALNNPLVSGATKLNRAVSLINEYRENRRNVIVFTFFREPIKWLQEAFENSYVLHGDIPPGKRQESIDRFVSPLDLNEQGRLLIAQITSGGVGLNIQGASAVILLEPQFNPAVEVQAIGRVHRMGQRNSVDVHRIVSANTIEEILEERLQQKQEIMALYAEDCYLKHLSPDAMDRDTDGEQLPDDEKALMLIAKHRILENRKNVV